MAEKSKKRRFLVGIAQAIAIIAVIVVIFFRVPAINKMAARKTDAPSSAGKSANNTAQKSGTSSTGNGTSNTTANTTNGSSADAANNGATPVQQQDAGEYTISVNKVEKNADSGYIAVTLDILNSSKVTLKFDPARQFSYVGLKSKTSNSPVVVGSNPTFSATEIKPNQTLSGVLYIKSFATEDGELRFSPNVGDPAYTVIPLIPVPANQ